MSADHPKHIRRKILLRLYERYKLDPLEMLGPQEFLADGTVGKSDLVFNMHYLHDRGLVEMMMGYNPPLFAAVRITANGIDLVENAFEFNRRFPPCLEDGEEHVAQIPHLVEALADQVEYAPLDGELRRALLRDVQYLRDELARPWARQRLEVIRQVLRWIEQTVAPCRELCPALFALQALLPVLERTVSQAATDAPDSANGSASR